MAEPVAVVVGDEELAVDRFADGSVELGAAQLADRRDQPVVGLVAGDGNQPDGVLGGLR